MRRFLVVLVGLSAACGSGGTEGPTSPLCAPGTAAPTWLTEGETVSIDVGCTTDIERSGDELAFRDLPAGATYDSASATLSWTPGLDQAAVWHLEVEVIESGELGIVTVGVADAYDDPDNVPVLDPEAYTHELGVPVLFFETAPSQSELDEPIVITYGGRTIDARGEKRGASSLSYPKNSFLLKFDSNAQFYDLDRDFVAKRRVVLTSTFDDNAYIRQRLVFELWNALEPSLPIATYSVVVYVGGDYFGLYTLTDHPSKHWLESLGHNGEANFYKAINHDANFRATNAQGNAKATLHDGFEKKEGAPGDFVDIDALVDFAINASDADFGDQIGDRIELADYNKWWALVVYTLAGDSAGKNSYHYHDDSKWLVVPWDFNASFGQSWETSRTAVTAVDQFRSRNELFRRNLDDATLGPAFRATLSSAIESGPFSQEAMNVRVSALIAELDESARRDWRKWSGEYVSHPRWSGRTDMTDYDGEMDYLLEWIEARGDRVLEIIAP